MAYDSEDSPSPPRASNRLLLVAGVAGACALGVGAGLWARPADLERHPELALMKPVVPPAPAGRLEIVLDDSPAPIGKPIEVLPGSHAPMEQASVPGPAFVAPAPLPAEPEPMAPTRPPSGLVKVQAVVTPAEPAPDLRRREAEKRAAEAAERKAAADQAKAEARKAAGLEAARLEQARQEKARADKAQRAEKLRVAKAEKAEASRRLAEKAPAAKTRLAKAKPKSKADHQVEVAETRRSGPLTKLAHALSKITPHHTAPPVQVAEAPKAHKAKPKGEGPLRVASAKRGRCASPDPGAAIVCADPALATADRRLSRAYREAEAAGVSPDQLQRQQERWLQARSAAAREAPWAVHDVYLARIAELNDQARDARTGGY